MDLDGLKVPNDRDLPPGHLEIRRETLVRQIRTEIERRAPRRPARSGGLRGRRRIAIFAPVAIALAATVLVTPAFGLRDEVLQALGIKHTGPARYNPLPANIAVPAIEREWQDNLTSGAAADPHTRFPNPPEAVFRTRLADAASRFHFVVERAEIRRPLQDAPFVVVRTNDPSRLADDLPSIVAIIDPKQSSTDDRAGWAYEGFFFEAQDAGRVPFVVSYNHWRGPDAGGGQWASSEKLLPYQHGSRASHDSAR